MCIGEEGNNYEYDQDDVVDDNKYDGDGDNFNDNGELVEDEQGVEEVEEEEEEEEEFD